MSPTFAFRIFQYEAKKNVLSKRARHAEPTSVTEQGMKIHAQTSAGIFWGAQTLR
jgi:hypothetical protein